MRLVFGKNLHSSVMGSLLLAMLLLVKDLNPNFITHLASVPYCWLLWFFCFAVSLSDTVVLFYWKGRWWPVGDLILQHVTWSLGNVSGTIWEAADQDSKVDGCGLTMDWSLSLLVGFPSSICMTSLLFSALVLSTHHCMFFLRFFIFFKLKNLFVDPIIIHECWKFPKTRLYHVWLIILLLGLGNLV
jgi:hypothetical protein